MAEIDIPGTIQFNNTNYIASELDGQATITVSRVGGSFGSVSVQLFAGNASDTADTLDYSLPATTVLNWTNGDMTDKTLDIAISTDSEVEGDETLTLFLQPPQLQELVSARAAHIVGGIDTTPATLTIQDSTIASPVVNQLRTVSGNFQEGVLGDTLNPFVITAVNASGTPVDAVTINWEVLPSNGGSLQQFSTVTNASGQSSNTLTLSTSNRMVVKATVDPNGGIGGPVGISNSGSAEVLFIVNGGLADVQGLTKNQKSVAKALDSACSGLLALAAPNAQQSDLLATCARLDTDTPTGVAASLDILAHEEVTAQSRIILETGKVQSASLHRRLADLRMGSRGVSLAGLKINIDGQTLPSSVVSALFGPNAKGGSAGEESSGIASRWGTFINATLIVGDRGETGQESGFDYRSEGVTIGADYRVSNQMVVGSALGYASKSSDFNNSTGDLEIDNWHLSAYGSYYRSDSFYIDGLVRLGSNEIDTRRQINLPGDPLQEGIGDTSGKEYAISLSSGYEFSQGAMTVGPYGRLGYIWATIDGYDESASNPGGIGAGSVLNIDNQDVDSLTSVLGGQVAYAISTRNGVYLLQLNTEWEHEFNDNSRGIAAQFAYDPTRTSFNIDSDNPDRDYFNLGLGVSAVFANGRSGFLRYESRLGQNDVNQYWINAGIRLEL